MLDPAARPPHPPISGGSGAPPVIGHDHELTSEDGTRFGACTALAGHCPRGPAVVILPDIRGLHDFYRDLAVRFAETGVHATALDYFGRTAGVGPRGDDFDWKEHVSRTTPEGIAADVRAAVEHVRSDAGGGADAVFTVGFCFGGRNSFNQAARGPGLAGVIGFYGRVAPGDDADREAPVLLAPAYRCPVLGLFGGADRNITRTDVAAFGEALDGAGIANDLIVYPGAPHSFFDRSFEEHRDACDDAWRRMLGFVEEHS